VAIAKTLKFANQVMLIGDGASPEVYEAPCGFTTLTLTVNIATNDTNVPDCDDPSLPSWLISDEVSKQMVLSGDGVLDTDAFQMWREWLLAGGEKNVRWFTSGTGANGGGYFQAPGIMSTYSENGQRGQRWNLSSAVTLNGKPAWTASA
jgi:hypothetical protein